MKVHLRYWKQVLAIALVFASATLYPASGQALLSIIATEEPSETPEKPPPDNKRKPRGEFNPAFASEIQQRQI